MQILKAAATAFIAESLGVATGMMLLYKLNIKNQRMIGMLFGGTSGIMIAMICFDLLPSALKYHKDGLVVLGILLGVSIGMFLENVISHLENKKLKAYNHMRQTAIILIMGIALHNIPEGFALGTIVSTAPQTLTRFALVIGLHSISEAMAIAIALKAAKTQTHTLILVPIFLGSIMSMGSVLGVILSNISKYCIILSLGLASGIILYIVCEELLPESRRVWNGRMTSVAIILGIIIGLVMLK